MYIHNLKCVIVLNESKKLSTLIDMLGTAVHNHHIYMYVHMYAMKKINSFIHVDKMGFCAWVGMYSRN
jgi:hypothetical protein